jgi:anti-sigma regulatory factor (Ser/Thr protein kinase)
MAWPPGSVLILFTDGLVEGPEMTLSEGMNRLVEAAAGASDLEPDALADRILDLAAGADRPDDIALLVARRLIPDGDPGSHPIGHPKAGAADARPVSRSDAIALPGDASSAGAARSFVRRTLTAWGADEFEEKVVLVVSELVTNAAVHAGTELQVSLRLAGETLRLEVRDGSPQMPRQRPLDLDATTGRGLRLVAALSRKWGAEEAPPGKMVWCEIGPEPHEP